ncbi:putative short/branched chain specific acyl-CoA dehydrogenase [Nocardia seriolae]|uniref:Short/branched chain specific acyl-CoA dehydrogenase n=1 Tax=Nocardia seriolae TaxID=37332 RepID=A0ABC8AVE1_9NOCA|nr:acyl-CoA dehydrogenase family protein [Nocardia seriolae]APA98063.1 putative short/branched chain specific acyl-CoA dehydrogenase [Nocardia seriolae]
MDFELTEAQRELSGLARELLADWSGRHPRPDDTGFDPQLWRAMADTGLLEAALPERVHGGGYGVLEQCAILTEIGRTVAPAPYSTSIAVGAATLAEFGDDHQIRRWVPPLLRGETTLAPVLARDFAAFEARTGERGWTLTGAQSAVATAAFADTFLIEARCDANPILVLLDRDTAGLTVTGQHLVDGTDAALLELRNVSVPGENVIVAPGAAAWAARRATLATCARQLGILERALEMTCEYARTRKQFDKPIGSFQAVRQRLADAYIDVEAVRLTLWQAAWRESHALPADPELAVAKFWAAEAGHRVAHTAVHVHASTGIYLDYPTQRYFTAAKRTEFESGPATTQLRHLSTHIAAPQPH